MFLYYLMVITMLLTIGLVVYSACKSVELEEPMELIISRRITKLKVIRCKKEQKIKELKLKKSKNNKESLDVKIKVLKIELLCIEREMCNLLTYKEI